MDGFRLTGDFVPSGDGDITAIICKWKQGKKEISANGVDYERITDHIGRFTAVMIAPDDMELINDGSELRRKWVDSILCQTDNEYFERLMRYQRVLQQRNAWLKIHFLNPPSDSTELEYYNKELAGDGNYIHERRKAFIHEFLPVLERYYRQLSSGKETIQVDNDTELKDNNLSELLNRSFQHDLRLQRTTKGVHKDDWNFMLNGFSLKNFGSQGQKKSFLFAIKLAQYTYLSQQLGHLPILLLDDIFEKLDQDRMEALLRIIRTDAFGQVLLTDTHTTRVKNAFGDGVEVGFIEL